MQAVILTAPGEFTPAETPVPELEPGDILLEMGAAAICGTDIRILEGKKTRGVRYPSVIGHEISGTVCRIGAGADDFSIGDRVAVANVIPCGVCGSCRKGMENACLQRRAIGYEYDGGFAQYIRIPALAQTVGNIYKLPDHVSFAEGALIEPLACCIRGMRNAKVAFGDCVLVVGGGPIGLMHLQLAKTAGASKVILSEPIASRREIAKQLGADCVVDPQNESLDEVVMAHTEGLGADVIILAIGVPSLVNGLLRLCRRGGTVNLFAGFSGTGLCEIEANLIHYGEINVNGSTAYRRVDYQDAVGLVTRGKIALAPLVTHTIPIRAFRQAYEICKSGEGLKVVIVP